MRADRGLFGVVAAAILAGSVLAVTVAVSPAAAAQKPESQSAALAVELAQMLDGMKLTNIAAQSDDMYAAALYIPGSQLLVVIGKFTTNEHINYLLSKKAYSDAYVDLNGYTDQATRILISDLGADGLRFDRKKDEPFDYVDVAGKSVFFNGEWGRKVEISREEYAEAYQRTDVHYARVLRAFIEVLKKSS